MVATKKYLFMLCLFFLGISVFAQIKNPEYDATLAKEMGADQYGMKSYYFVILKTGKAVIDNKQVRDSIYSGHLKNIQNLEEKNKLIVAGPLGSNNKDYRGIYIFNVSTEDEVHELLKTDPAVDSDLLEAEIYEWYGSAALPEYLKVHKKIAKELF